MKAIRYNLAHLLTFSGREDRRTFWFYALALMIAGAALRSMVFAYYYREFAARHVGLDVAEAASMATTQTAIVFAVDTVLSLMGVAAYVRRLHDSGLSGAWVLVPIAFCALPNDYFVVYAGDMMAISLEGFASQTADVAAALSHRTEMSIMYWAGLLLTLVLASRASDEEQNHYGEPFAR